MQSNSTPCQRESLPLSRAGTVRRSMTTNITGRSMTREELMPPAWDEIFDAETKHALYLEQKKSGTVVVGKKIGRNDPCPCGSGKKYKKCCGKNA